MVFNLDSKRSELRYVETYYTGRQKAAQCGESYFNLLFFWQILPSEAGRLRLVIAYWRK